MSRWESWILHLSMMLVTVSGVAYFWAKYLVKASDPFSVINHPLQPFFLKLHLISAPFLLFIVGILFSSHIAKKLSGGTPSNKRSGIVSLVTFPLMVFSGYLLQIFSDPLFLQISVLTHIASSALFIVAYSIHLAISIVLWRRIEKEELAARSRMQLERV
ncbi:MAG: hypothetical protein HY645_00170 [Acidobacteria bacterium]|nr:hypothetical protein [Acidobacteriota bacterium]